MQRPDSILGLITGPSVNFWFMHSLLELFGSDTEQRFNADRLLAFGPYIHTNRNQLQREFMDIDRQWLFMVDNDMVFDPADVWVLFAEADANGPGIYSAPYMIENGVLVCGPWDDQEEMVYHPMIGLPSEPKQVGVVGGGFTLIHHDVFEAVGEKAFSPIQESSGEDVSFCWRARQAGYTPVLVPKANPGHFKQVALFPHEQVRNMIGEEVNLVEVDPAQVNTQEEVKI